MTEYDAKRRIAETKAELRATVKELMAWHARGRMKLILMRLAIATWVGLLLLATAVWVLT